MKKGYVYVSANLKTICPDCNIKRKSFMAKRCMECHVIWKNTGMTEYVTRNQDFRNKLKKKVRELAKEQGRDLATMGIEEESN